MQRFPQKRNGVGHAVHGFGVVTMGEHFVVQPSSVQVKFEKIDTPIIVKIEELWSSPAHGESPDPKTSRNSGWVGHNNYRTRK